MSDHRWQGYTHAELFELLHQGPGPSASGTCAHRWRQLERTFREIDDGMAAALRAVAADWEGEASDSVRRGLRPLHDWTEDVSRAAGRMRRCSEQQAEFIARARAEMPPPVRVTAEEPNGVTSALVHLFGGQTDYERQERQQQAAEQRAFDVMRRYQDSSEENATELASFEAPPQVVVDTPARSASGGAGEVAISWTRPRPGGTGAVGGATAGTSRSSAGPTSGTGAGRTGSRPAAGFHGSGRQPASTRGSRPELDEEREAPVEATESTGGTGPFDDPRVSARPVIGGESRDRW